MTSNAPAWIAAYRTSQDRMRSLVADLDGAGLEAPSYDSEWSIGQVLSHVGSQAEIMDLFLDVALDGSEAPGGEVFPPIWDVWNAKEPLAWRDDALAANERHVTRLESLTPQQIEDFRISMFGMDLDLVGFLGMRLGEYAVHTWDVAVALDPAATISEDAVPLLVDSIARTAGRGGKPVDGAPALHVVTTSPDRAFLLERDGAVAITPAESAAAAPDLTLPAEAFVRLVYGRLDPEHTPDVTSSSPQLLDDLRATFPGF